jgi:hypothetical protein
MLLTLMLGGVNDQPQTLTALTHGGEILWCLPGKKLIELQSHAKEKDSCFCLKLNVGYPACRPYLPISFPGPPGCIYFSGKLSATHSKNKNIRELCRGINYFEKGYQPRTNLVKDIIVICLQISTTFSIGGRTSLSYLMYKGSAMLGI